jgi:hypothetical protein
MAADSRFLIPVKHRMPNPRWQPASARHPQASPALSASSAPPREMANCICQAPPSIPRQRPLPQNAPSCHLAWMEAEYERRLCSKNDPSPTSQSLAARIAQPKRGIARRIDAYGEGLLERDEFEPKIRQLKPRLTRLEVEQQGLAQEEARRADLRLIIGQLEEFTQRMDQGLEEAPPVGKSSGRPGTTCRP